MLGRFQNQLVAALRVWGETFSAAIKCVRKLQEFMSENETEGRRPRSEHKVDGANLHRQLLAATLNQEAP